MVIRSRQLFAIAVFMVMFLSVGQCIAKSDQTLSVDYLDGPVKIRPQHSSTWQDLYQGESLPPLADVIVPEGARVGLDLPGERSLQADEWTMFSYDEKVREEPESTIHLGSIRLNIPDESDEKTAYRIHTPSGVAGIRGTKVTVEQSDLSRLMLGVEDGSIDFIGESTTRTMTDGQFLRSDTEFTLRNRWKADLRRRWERWACYYSLNTRSARLNQARVRRFQLKQILRELPPGPTEQDKRNELSELQDKIKRLETNMPRNRIGDSLNDQSVSLGLWQQGREKMNDFRRRQTGDPWGLGHLVGQRLKPAWRTIPLSQFVSDVLENSVTLTGEITKSGISLGGTAGAQGIKWIREVLDHTTRGINKTVGKIPGHGTNLPSAEGRETPRPICGR